MKLLNSKAAQELFNDPFEQTLLKSAYSCLHNLNDPLRCNLFALVLRELIRTTMDRLAPEAKVVKAPWYSSKKITRADRYRFALTGNLTDRVIAKYPDLDTSDERKVLKDTSDELSK